jgi:HEAT repeat protein
LVADVLGETRHPSAVPALTEAARGQFYTVRARAAAALAKIGDPQAVPILIEMLGDKEPSVRIAASLALGKFKDPRCLVRLSDVLLEDKEIEVRQAAAQGLAETRLLQAIPYLIEAMQDSFWWYERENAAKPLLEAVASLGADAVEPLCEALRNPEGTVRRSAALILAKIGDPRAIEPLGAALYDVHFEVGEAAAHSLARFGADALEVLGEALLASESGIRLHGLSALGHIKDARVLPMMTGLLKDNDRHVVKQAIKSIAESGDPRALSILEPIAIDRTDRELSMLAREALKALSPR